MSGTSQANGRLPSVARATALVAFSACCFGSIAILVTVATRAGARLSEVLAWRFLIAALLLAIVAGGPSAVRREARRGLPLMVLAAAVRRRSEAEPRRPALHPRPHDDLPVLHLSGVGDGDRRDARQGAADGTAPRSRCCCRWRGSP
jgi:hypothetical protein